MVYLVYCFPYLLVLWGMLQLLARLHRQIVLSKILNIFQVFRVARSDKICRRRSSKKISEDNNFENSIIIGKRRRGMSPRCPWSGKLFMLQAAASRYSGSWGRPDGSLQGASGTCSGGTNKCLTQRSLSRVINKLIVATNLWHVHVHARATSGKWQR